MSSTELLELATLQDKLDDIYEEKTRGAFVRSRQKWMEAGVKKKIKYFFGLEKKLRNNFGKQIVNKWTCL